LVAGKVGVLDDQRLKEGFLLKLKGSLGLYLESIIRFICTEAKGVFIE
jgi:hypothetical protein